MELPLLELPFLVPHLDDLGLVVRMEHVALAIRLLKNHLASRKSLLRVSRVSRERWDLSTFSSYVLQTIDLCPSTVRHLVFEICLFFVSLFRV